MKKLFSILLLLSCFIAEGKSIFPLWVPKAKMPEPIQQFWETPRIHETPNDKYWHSFSPETAHDIGWKYATLIMRTIRVDDNTYWSEGFRTQLVRYGNGMMDSINTYYSQWTDHTIGTPGTSLQQVGQGVFAFGDRALINVGSYTGGTIAQIANVVFVPTTGRITFNGTLGWRNIKGCEISFLTFTGYTGDGMDMRAYGPGPAVNGPITNCYLHNIAFLRLQSQCINANGGFNYTYGDTSTAAWYKVTIDSVFEDSCALLCQGSFGSPGDNTGSPPNVMDLTTITRLYSIATSATNNEGVEIRGIQFRCNYNHWVVINKSGRGNSGDCGLVYGHGNGMFWCIYKYGGPGYIDRMSPCRDMLLGPANILVFNNIKANGNEYGLTCEQQPDSVAGKCANVDSVCIYNNTAFNLPTFINYWCQLAVIGTRGWPRYQIRNNIAVKIADQASNGAGHDNGTFTQRVVFNQGEAWPTETQDTSNNQYWNTSALAGIDTVTIFITNRLGSFPKYQLLPTTRGQILHGGTSKTLSGTDFAGNAMRSPPDLGYLQLISGAGAVNYIPGRRVRKVIVVR